MKEIPFKLAGKQSLIKYVKKASQWCRTSWDEKGRQKQEWFNEKPPFHSE